MLAIALLLSGCATDPQKKALGFVGELAKTECMGLQQDAEAICSDTVNKRISTYFDYLENNRALLDILQKRNEDLQRRGFLLKEACSTGDKGSCNQLKITESNLANIQKRYQATYSKQQEAGKRVYKAIALTPETIAEKKTNTKIICKVGEIGSVACAKIASLIAFYDADTSSTIIRDLNRLYEVFQLQTDEQVAVGCGDGVWGSYQTSSDVDASAVSAFVSEHADKIAEACLKVSERVRDRGRSLAKARGFSGITGIDGMGGRSICGLDIGGGATAEEIVAKANTMRDIAAQECASSPQTNLMEGTPSTGATTTTTTTTDGDTVTTTTSSDGTTTTTITTDSEGNTTIKQTTTTTTATGGLTTTTSTTTTTTVDSNGDVTGTSYSANVKTVDSTTGTTTIVNMQQDQDGNFSGTKKTVDADGTTTIQDLSGDSKVTTTGQTSVLNPPGGTLTDYDLRAPDGTRIRIVDIKHPDGTRLRLYGDGFGVSYDKDGNVNGVWKFPDGDCLDEACTACKKFFEYYSDLFDECIRSDGRSQVCQSWNSAADCCGNKDAFPADPRIVIPNPSGDFVCLGGEDPDLKQEACEAKCGVAEHVDCNSLCMLSEPGDLGFNAFDSLCLYAISEECFSSSGSIVVAPEEGGTIPDGTLPLPTEMSDRFVLPRF